MEHIVIIVDQLEEAKRLIQMGELSHLRMALLLLDNTSEVLMWRVIRDRLQRQEFLGPMYYRAREVMPPHEFESWKVKFAYEPLSAKRRKSIEREYKGKVDFLIAEHKLTESVGKVLKAIHRYRNEAYHRDKLRKGTIQPAVAVLFDIVTDLLVELKSGSAVFSSTDDWTSFWARYQLDHRYYVLDGGLEKVRESLKEGMLLEVKEIAIGLAEHLCSRLDEIDGALEFIAENSQGDFTPQQEIKRIQLLNAQQYFAHDSADPIFAEFAVPRSIEDLRRWRAQAEKLRNEANRLALFTFFADLELEMEPLEEQVHEVATQIDSAIQMAIDIARGK